MKCIWIDREGYWWTKVWNGAGNDLCCWLVPEQYDPNDEEGSGWEPPEYLAYAEMLNINDTDNDLLPDTWEGDHFGDPCLYDRYDDPDDDSAQNLEELLAGTSPVNPNDNDSDGDDLPDNWERHFFGSLDYGATDDPDLDGLFNDEELAMGLHPSRTAVDRDCDGMPDTWEMRWFSTLDEDIDDVPADDCYNNLDEYALGFNPTRAVGDIDCSSEIELLDFGLFAHQEWLSSGCHEPSWCGGADLDLNGSVGLKDFAILVEAWLWDW
jgi:hypothetical protein